MTHEIHRVTGFEQVGPYVLEVSFEDGSKNRIDFEPVLAGEIYGPLKDAAVFAQVSLDTEAATLVWPNGADFDPDTLFHWQVQGPALARMAESWHLGRRVPDRVTSH